MIEFRFAQDNGRRAYRHSLSAEDNFRLIIAGEQCTAINLSENGIAYEGAPVNSGELIAAKLAFDLDGLSVIISCNLRTVRSVGDLNCCLITALSDSDRLILSRYLMECQKRQIRRERYGVEEA